MTSSQQISKQIIGGSQTKDMGDQRNQVKSLQTKTTQVSQRRELGKSMM